MATVKVMRKYTRSFLKRWRKKWQQCKTKQSNASSKWPLASPWPAWKVSLIYLHSKGIIFEVAWLFEDGRGVGGGVRILYSCLRRANGFSPYLVGVGKLGPSFLRPSIYFSQDVEFLSAIFNLLAQCGTAESSAGQKQSF